MKTDRWIAWMLAARDARFPFTVHWRSHSVVHSVTCLAWCVLNSFSSSFCNDPLQPTVKAWSWAVRLTHSVGRYKLWAAQLIGTCITYYVLDWCCCRSIKIKVSHILLSGSYLSVSSTLRVSPSHSAKHATSQFSSLQIFCTFQILISRVKFFSVSVVKSISLTRPYFARVASFLSQWVSQFISWWSLVRV